MSKIAIFGGTFNPIHNGHLHIAHQYKKLLQADEVLFVPTFAPPHKSARMLASAADRLQMCRLACTPDSFQVSDIEIRRGGASYTVDTLQEIAEEYRGDDLYLLMGEDMFLTLENWRNPHRIYSLCTICAAPRSRNGLVSMQAYARTIESFGATVILHNIEYLPVSSTMIRRAVKRGERIAGLTPDAVAAYIEKRGLYGGNA